MVERLRRAEDIEDAKSQFMTSFAACGKADKGEKQQATDFAQGAMIALLRGDSHQFWIKKDDAQKFIGLIRLEVSQAEVKIANLAGIPGRGVGRALIEATIDDARAGGKQKVKLNANEAGLVGYYERYGFEADQPNGLNMTLALT